MMYFIIIHYSNSEYFLSVDKILYKGKNNVCCIGICYCELKLKNKNNTIKKLKTDVGVKLLFFMIYTRIY